MSDELMDREELFFENETRKHQQEVAKNMISFAMEILRRATVHDASKLVSPEREIFIRMTPRLRDLTYGSDEYKAALEEMGEALTHHYRNNSHHPEYFSLYEKDDDISNMNLLDVVEMMCDWAAACKRHDDGNAEESLRINEKRFCISNQLISIIRNTLLDDRSYGYKAVDEYVYERCRSDDRPKCIDKEKLDKLKEKDFWRKIIASDEDEEMFAEILNENIDESARKKFDNMEMVRSVIPIKRLLSHGRDGLGDKAFEFLEKLKESGVELIGCRTYR